MIPEGWDTQHFNRALLEELVVRFYFRYTRLKGYTDDETVIQDRLKRVFYDYARIRKDIERKGSFVEYPAALLKRILHRAQDDFDARHDNTAPDMFKGVFKGSHDG